MADSTPRHLAEPSRRFGLSPLQQLFLVAMLSLAAITAVIALLTRDAGTGGRRAAGPATTQAQAATTATTATAATDHGPRPAPRPPPGRSGPPRGTCSPTATSSATWPAGRRSAGPGWSGSRAGRPAAGRPPSPPAPARAGQAGMVRREAATAREGTTYEAIFWVQAPERRPGRPGPARAGRRPRGQRRPGRLHPARRAAGSSSRSSTTPRPPGRAWPWRSSAHDLPGDGRLLVDSVDLQTE